ncbi:MAG TPA: hypothetical protein VFQ97_06495 [Gallionella sp.]|nr:hypothetical protein [Gallionella sp.]
MPYMDDVNSKAGFEPGGENDRRSQHNLRLIFDKACQITAPFFDSKLSWGGSSLTMYARQTLREAFPELTQQEIAILFSAVTRFHRSPPKNSQAPSAP